MRTIHNWDVIQPILETRYIGESYMGIWKQIKFWASPLNKSIINIHNIKIWTVIYNCKENEPNSNPITIANGFNNYFSDNYFSHNLQDNIHSNSSFSDYLKNTCEQSLFLEPVDSQEIIFIINSIDNSKASGPHSIPTDILKLIKCNIVFHYLI